MPIEAVIDDVASIRRAKTAQHEHPPVMATMWCAQQSPAVAGMLQVRLRVVKSRSRHGGEHGAEQALSRMPMAQASGGTCGAGVHARRRAVTLDQRTHAPGTPSAAPTTRTPGRACFPPFVRGPLCAMVLRDTARVHGTQVARFEIYRRAQSEAGDNATVCLGMLNDRGGLATAQYLINAAQPSDGSTNLHQRGRLDCTVEARVVENATWHELFTREALDKARRRLIAYEYAPREPNVHR